MAKNKNITQDASNNLKIRGVMLQTLQENILCFFGLHNLQFNRFWKGAFRPHFTCKRKDCTYFKD